MRHWRIWVGAVLSFAVTGAAHRLGAPRELWVNLAVPAAVTTVLWAPLLLVIPGDTAARLAGRERRRRDRLERWQVFRRRIFGPFPEGPAGDSARAARMFAVSLLVLTGHMLISFARLVVATWAALHCACR